MSAQLALDEPYPATKQEREAAISKAFGGQAPVKIVSVRAARVRCPVCREPVGRSCSQWRPGGRRMPRKVPHPSRSALTVRCETHDVAAGVPCPEGACETRLAAVVEDVTILAGDAVVRARAS